MSGKFDFVDRELARRKKSGQSRCLRPFEPLGPAELRAQGRRLVNFSANDYLGLAFHPLLRERAAQWALRWGSGASASRLVCGTYPGLEQVEETIARLKGTDKALVLGSGYQANVSVVAALARRKGLVLCDRLAHHSLLQGALAGPCPMRRYRHRDMGHLRQLLVSGRGAEPILIVTESVFSMDGDCSDIGALVDLAAEFGAILLVDEAHATGVMGARGMGLSVGKGVDVVVGTFSKACGAYGAYVACNQRLWEYLINCCGGLIYSTTLPPSVLGAVDAALELIPQMEAERVELKRKADFLRQRLAQLDWDTADSDSQIVPALVGDEQVAVGLAGWLEEQGLLAAAIRPPAVEPGRSRLRLALSAGHTWAQMEYLADRLGYWRGRTG